jgi:hypothetical protein
MKKTLFLTVTLLLLPATAHARPTMPDIMVGLWCANENEATFDNKARVGTYHRTSAQTCDRESVVVKPHYVGLYGEMACFPIIVQRLFKDNYLIRAKCGETTDQPLANFDFWLDVSEYDHSLQFVPMNVSKNWFHNLLMTNWYVLDEHCRGDSEDKAIVACDKARPSLTLALNKLGYCYGKLDQSHAEMEWHKCTRDSIRVWR